MNGEHSCKILSINSKRLVKNLPKNGRGLLFLVHPVHVLCCNLDVLIEGGVPSEL